MGRDAENRAPYGSKILRVVIAAIELYEFTRTQLINYTTGEVTASDFENAKREGKPLELGRVLIENGQRVTKRAGRPEKIYTFKNMHEYEWLAEWVNSYGMSGDWEQVFGERVGSRETSEIAPESRREMNESIQILINLTNNFSDPNDEIIWIKRGMRHLAKEMGQIDLDKGVIDNPAELFFQGDYLGKYLRFQQSLIATKGKVKDKPNVFEEDLWTLIDIMASFCKKFNQPHEQKILGLSGLVDAGLNVIEALFLSINRSLSTEKLIKNYSLTWELGQWEEREKRLTRVLFITKPNLLCIENIMAKIFIFWKGLRTETAALVDGETIQTKSDLVSILGKLDDKVNIDIQTILSLLDNQSKY